MLRILSGLARMGFHVPPPSPSPTTCVFVDGDDEDEDYVEAGACSAMHTCGACHDMFDMPTMRFASQTVTAVVQEVRTKTSNGRLYSDALDTPGLTLAVSRIVHHNLQSLGICSDQQLAEHWLLCFALVSSVLKVHLPAPCTSQLTCTIAWLFQRYIDSVKALSDAEMQLLSHTPPLRYLSVPPCCL